MRVYKKSFVAMSLAVAMSISGVAVYAKSNPTLSVQNKRIAIGERSQIVVKNAKKGATYQWTSSNKKVMTVNKKGIVTGKKLGTATITCTIRKGKEQTKQTITMQVVPLKQMKETDIVVGEKATLRNKQYKKVTYQWSSDQPSIVAVNKKGVITAKQSGTATVRCTIVTKKKSFIEQYTIKVNTKKIVVNQTQLNQALKNSKLSDIVIQTQKEENFTIPSGTYQNITLAVDAKNADINNYGRFSTIVIDDIKSDTWHEYAKGNTLQINAKNAHMIVEDTGSVEAVVLNQKDAKSVLEVHGELKKVEVAQVGEVQILGHTKTNIAVEMKGEAEGTKLTSALPVKVTTPVKVDITLEKGAEQSTLEVTKEVDITVKNNTESNISIQAPTGNKNVASGQTSESNTTQTETPSTNTGGSVGGSSGSSMEDTTPSPSQPKPTVMELSKLQEILDATETEVYTLNAYVTIPDNETLTIPEGKTLNIIDGGKISVEKGGNIENKGQLVTSEKQITGITTLALKERTMIQSATKIDIDDDGNIFVASGSSIKLGQLEDISQTDGQAILCYPGGTVFVGEKQYIGSNEEALIQFHKDSKKTECVGFSRNGDGKVCLFVIGDVQIPNDTAANALDCLLIIKGDSNPQNASKLTIPNMNVIDPESGSIHVESNATFIIGNKTYFAPSGVENSVFNVTNESVYNNSKGLTLYYIATSEDNTTKDRLIFWICGEITMNEALPQQYVYCMTRGAYSGELTLNLTSEAEELEVSKDWIVKKEHFHSNYVGNENNDVTWQLNDSSNS